MKSFIFILIVACCDFVFGQSVRRASLLQHRQYMIDVVSETVQEVEDFHWCNLKIPEFSYETNITVFGRRILGEVSYKNGYVVSVQHLDILQSSVQQVWTWNSADQFGRVDVRAQLRMHDVVLGFDVVADIDGGKHVYTSTFRHPLTVFNFSIQKNMKTKEITVTVTGVDPRSSGRMSYIPSDKYSDLLGTLFASADTVAGILSWGPEIFQPKAYHVVTSKVEFPEACYNC